MDDWQAITINIVSSATISAIVAWFTARFHSQATERVGQRSDIKKELDALVLLAYQVWGEYRNTKVKMTYASDDIAALERDLINKFAFIEEKLRGYVSDYKIKGSNYKDKIEDMREVATKDIEDLSEGSSPERMNKIKDLAQQLREIL